MVLPDTPAMMLMPSLFRFLCITALLVSVTFTTLWVLATFVEPVPREFTVTIPVDASKL